ncbi:MULTISPECIES: 5-formyltetrahydrofolate cyclo-ligase [unclassified Flavobacterium]|uniref:5-formyltetrahydrofolate cyclo-ligase n=1 Tax=unclassified Flavobacterium TaxID=196869 RepID=UPI001290FE4C|nr:MULTISPECIES: 5-formyltetrahydrofolate cyclo-ligase [unclassified Flavobacterium]MQP51654.1 5-formyltetrahydrofolate cyclo-ligase [Flavobacterium sp. LMO9]MQP61118.1 5-formyltetrahydrofolate cyclo-ligase [Flavobacterium sp. LMO6]
MDKKSLRQKAKAERQKLTYEEIEDKSLAIANQLLRMDAVPSLRLVWDKLYYHLFLTIEEQKEINTEYILQILAGKDKEIVISKCDFATLGMTHFLLTDNTKIKKNSYNVPEPVDGLEVPDAKIDVVFVPLLAYDKQGNRVGYGKGFYDNFLSKCKPETIKIGLSFFPPEEKIKDVSENDVKLDFCVTPEGIIEF